MNVSIIICTSNRAEHLAPTLQSLAAVHVPDTLECELLVIDNASTDATAQVIEQNAILQMPTRRLYLAERGLSRARNHAVTHALGDIIIFTDDDMRFPENWIAEMTAPILSGDADAVGGGVTLARHLERPWMEAHHRAFYAETLPGNEPSLVGANMAFSRKVLSQVPGFDIELGAGALGVHEETLFSRQLVKAGYKVINAHHIAVEHHFQEDRLTRGNLLRAAQNNGRSSAYVMYHWEHETKRLLPLRILIKTLQLWIWRLKHRRQCARIEGMDVQEIHLIAAIYKYKQYAIESVRPRKYSQHGLTLLNR